MSQSPLTHEVDDPLTSSKAKPYNTTSVEMIEDDQQVELTNSRGDEEKRVLLDEESDEEHLGSLLTVKDKTRSGMCCSSLKTDKKDMVQLHTQIPVHYLRIGKHIVVFIGVMLMCAIMSGFVFRELTKNSVPYTKVGEYAYQQGSFLSYLMTGEKVSSGMFHVGFIIYEIGAILALAAFCYKAGSFLTFIKNNPNANIHQFESYTWGGTSSYGGKNDGTGDMSLKMLRMLYFAISHGFMLIGLFKCVIIIFISMFRRKKL